MGFAAGSRLLLAPLLLGLLVGLSPPPGKSQQVKVLFTPMVCRVQCSSGRCVNRCQQGNATTLYSGENVKPVEGASGFRVFLCPLICQNGGVCLKKDKCLCPSSWTGKFCHIPALPQPSQGQTPTRRGAEAEPEERKQSTYTLPIANHRYERDGVASVASVHVEHPPEASVTVHRVERVSQDLLPPTDTNTLLLPRLALNRVLAQSSPPDPGGHSEISGFGYCFRQLHGDECKAPLPGLRTREVCCRGSGVAWGVHGCSPCVDGALEDSGPGGRNEVSCPRGFLRSNGSCVDVDECQGGSFCRNGHCTNTRGSFTCLCQQGYILDSSRESCISHQVISEAKGPCFRVLRDGGCLLPILRNITKQICCCSRVGKAWGRSCEGCPPFGSEGFKEICPAGPGYHYSASDLRYDTRFLGHSLPRGGRERPRTTAAPPAILLRSAQPTSLRERLPWHVTTLSPGTRPPAPEAARGVCEQRPQQCGRGRCLPRQQGGYTCVCDRGYWLSPQGTHCIDVDECAQTPQPCTGGGLCQNTLGSFHCSCPRGYQADSSGFECQDIDECQEHPGCQPGHCENVPGGYHCNCPIGYQPSPLGTQCEDVDECLQSPPPCGSGRCENVPGGYRCLCLSGFRASLTEDQCLDINECLEGDFCFPRGECLNTEGSYRCLCAQGFVAAPDGASCKDIDECLDGTACAGGHCANTEGSFDCYCLPGTRSTASKAACVDIDECQEYGPALCGTQRCENSAGSYHCAVACQVGYQVTAAGDCADVDECQEYGARLCGEKQCENTLGSYHCVTSCQSGYQPAAGGDCVDVNECQNSSACGAHATCHNLPGSFQCACDQGYETSREGRLCLDVNECETLQSVCGAASCENVEGSFLCLCPQAGEEFDPMTGHCTATSPRRPEAAGAESWPSSGASDSLHLECYYDPNAAQACENVLARNVTRQECCCSLGHAWGLDCRFQACPSPGSVQYQSLCPHGSGFTTATLRNAPPAVADVDECGLFRAQVCKGGVCVNKVPGYACYCPNGYYYETQHLQCIDNDECLDEEAEPCLGGLCINTIGSYYCSCAAPLMLDPSQRRCVTNESRGLEDHLAVCWQEVGPDLVCGRPRLDRQVTYAECCCLYGEAWSMNCALCPARDADDFEALCHALQRPSYGPVHPRRLGMPSEYGGGGFLPYSPEVYSHLTRPNSQPPSYDPLPREPLFGPLPYEDPDDLSYGDPQQESLAGYQPHSPSEPDWPFPPRGRGHAYPERPSRASEGYSRLEGAGEECGILSGCENGQCIQVADGFTCACHEGYRLDPTHMACLDIDECREMGRLCSGGRCLNLDGSYRCLCPPNTVPTGQPPRCLQVSRSQA